MSETHPTLLSDLTPREKLNLLALEMVCVHLSATYTTSEEVLPAAKEFLDFIATGDYEIEEADGDVVDFPKIVKTDPTAE